MSTEVKSPSQVVVVSATKSMGISILLTFLFGPLGMLYSTIPGAIIMAIISLPVALLTVGFGLLITWPICIIWGAAATSAHNKRLLAGAMSPTASPMAEVRIAQPSEVSDVSFDVAAEQKQCRACAEHIKLEALKCKHCGEIFDPNAVRTEIEQRKTEFEQSKAAMLKLLEGEIFYSEGWWRTPPGGTRVGPFSTREQAATQLQP
jgi:hypothetical protein